MSQQKQSSKKSGSSGNKKPQLSWTNCEQCKVKYISKCDDNKHECFGNVEKLLVSNDRKQFYLHEKFAYLNLIEQPKDDRKELQLISKECAFDFAFLNPATMKLLKLALGDPILLRLAMNESDSIEIVCTCWPSTQIDQSDVSITKTYLNLNGIKLDVDSSVILFSSHTFDRYKADQVEIELINNRFEDQFEINLIESFFKEIYLNKYILSNKQTLLLNYMGQQLFARVVKIHGQEDLSAKLEKSLRLDGFSCSHVYEITSSTKFSISSSRSDNNNNIDEVNQSANRSITFKDVAGLDREIQILKEFFINPFEYSHVYRDIGVDISKGVLLYGSSGCGKTMLAQAVCNESKCSLVKLNVSDIYSRNYGESESKLKSFFQEAWKKAPCILFIDELDTLCSRRENMNQELEKRIVAQFTSLVEQSKSKRILLLATTNKIDSIDSSLRRPGRFDKEIEIPIPNRIARQLILKSKLDNLKHRISEADLTEIAQNCHGYVGADLDMLVQESGLACVQRLIMETKSASDGEITVDDMKSAMRKIKPSAMREITFDIPKVSWEQIGGQHDLKKKLQQAIVWPIKHAESFKRLNIRPPRGILMYGPPGCSKTMIAKALATETGLNFIAVKGPEIFSKWVGESERLIREIFRKARTAAPAIIFFDEIDAIATERSSGGNKSNNVGDRVLAQLLNEMDGVENLNDVTIVAATNRPDMIDKALMRPGRLDRIVYVTLPDLQTRKEIFELKKREIPFSDDIDLDELARNTEMYSGAELAAVCNEAAYLALDSDINCAKLSREHFNMALKIVTPRTSDESIAYFDNFSFNMNSNLNQ